MVEGECEGDGLGVREYTNKNRTITEKEKEKEKMEVKIELMEGGMMPVKEFEESAGYDLRVPSDMKVRKGRQVIPLGFRMALPAGTCALIFSRSGVASKGVSGFLSASTNEDGDEVLCNVKQQKAVMQRSMLKVLCEKKDTLVMSVKKTMVADAKPDADPDSEWLDVEWREKMYEPIRFEECDVKLGMVDCGYRGEVGLIVDNKDVEFYLKKGASIAQMLILNMAGVEMKSVDCLNETERGEQGFNS